MANATEQCQTMEKLQKALRAINRKLEINKHNLKDHKKQLRKHRRELQAAKGGDPIISSSITPNKKLKKLMAQCRQALTVLRH